MPQLSSERVALLLATARKNPEFATRMLQNLPPEARELVLAELSKVKRPETTPLDRPGLKKCRAPCVNNGMSAQLNLFAKAVSRVS